MTTGSGMSHNILESELINLYQNFANFGVYLKQIYQVVSI